MGYSNLKVYPFQSPHLVRFRCNTITHSGQDTEYIILSHPRAFVDAAPWNFHYNWTERWNY